MPVPLPPPTLVILAVDIYLRKAYGEKEPPQDVRQRVARLRSDVDGDFFDSPAFELQPNNGPTRFALRLGNPAYPHMKLAMEPQPDQGGYLFRADTHDRHICPKPGTPEHAAFSELMRFNQTLSESIEQAWAEADVPTFKSYLRADLERRKREAGKR